MGHSTSSGRAAQPQRRSIAESLGITNEQLTARSQQAINSLTQGRLRDYDTRQATIVNAETNTIYDAAVSKDLMERRGFVLALYAYEGSPRDPGGRTRRRVIDYQHFDNATQVKNAIYNATGVPKPQRQRG